MLQMELYKLLKRKLVLIILLGLFSYVLYVNVRGIGNPHRPYELEKYEAAKGILTDERLENFFENYEREEVDIFENSFMKDGNLKKVSELDAAYIFCGEKLYGGIVQHSDCPGCTVSQFPGCVPWQSCDCPHYIIISSECSQYPEYY